MLHDLESNTEAGFAAEVSSWGVTTLASSLVYTNCAGQYLLGGFGVLGVYGVFGVGRQDGDYFSKTYTTIPSHSFVYFTMTFWALDSWNPPDYFIIFFDNYQISTWSLDVNQWPTDYCALPGSQDLGPLRIYGRFPHSGSTLTVKVVSKMDQESLNESFGVRDFSFLFVANPLGTSYTCVSPSSLPGLPATWPTCSCSSNINAASCSTCDPSCSSCFGTGSNQCYRCASGYTWDGSNCVACYTSCSLCSGSAANQCLTCKTGYFLWKGNTCISACDLPLTQTQTTVSTSILVPTVSQATCSSSCADTANPYLYRNGSCISTCQDFFKVTTRGEIDQKFCDYPCASNEFLYQNGSCLPTCQDGFNQRKEGAFQFCDFPCSSSNFLYLNGSCLPVCQDFFKKRTEGSYKFCNYPCGSNEYLFSNGNCSTTCQDLFLQRIEGTLKPHKFCDFPCQLNEFLYENSSCLLNCQDHFSQRIEGSFKFCDYPCQLNEYLYSNNTCSTTCQDLFLKRVEGSHKFCDYPCQLNEFLYENGSCYSTCQDSFHQRIEGPFKFCDYPCQPSEFLYENSSCSSTCQDYFNQRTEGHFQFCDYPCPPSEYLSSDGHCSTICQNLFLKRVEGSHKFCDYPCRLNEFLYQSGFCSPSCQTSFKARVEGSFQFCEPICEHENDLLIEDEQCITPISKATIKNSQIFNSAVIQFVSGVIPGRAISISAALAGRIFFNIKFFNINYSSELQEASKGWLPSFLALGITPDLPHNFAKKFPEREVPSTFEKYGMPASFFLNFWEDLGMMLIIMVGWIVLCGLEFLLKLLPLRKVRSGVQNFLLVTSYGIWADIFLFASLEYRSLEFARDLSMFSFAVSLIFMCGIFTGLYFHMRLIYRYQAIKIKSPDGGLETFNKENETVKPLYGDYIDRSYASQGFLVVLIMRELLFSLVLIAFYSHPNVQTGIFFASYVLTLAFMVQQRPFKRKLDFIQQIFFEIVGLMATTSVLFNSGFPAHDNRGLESRRIFSTGRFLIILNIIFNFASAGLMLIQISWTVYESWKEHKSKQVKKVSPLPLETVPTEECSPELPKHSHDISFQPQLLTLETQPDRSGFGDTLQTQANRSIIPLNLQGESPINQSVFGTCKSQRGLLTGRRPHRRKIANYDTLETQLKTLENDFSSKYSWKENNDQ